jgi:hypothetical protein
MWPKLLFTVALLATNLPAVRPNAAGSPLGAMPPQNDMNPSAEAPSSDAPMEADDSMAPTAEVPTEAPTGAAVAPASNSTLVRLLLPIPAWSKMPHLLGR